MLVTFRFKDTDTLSCGSLDDFTYKLNDEKKELEIYKKDEFLGYYAAVYGIPEEEFIEYIVKAQK